jgi:RNA polymerase sigma-70 factor (ECF subfamily)
MSQHTMNRQEVDGAFRRHANSLRAFLLRKTRGDRERAEDLLQDVFLAAISDLEHRPANTPVLAWLYTVANRRFVDDLRKRGRTVETVAFEERGLDGADDRTYGPAVARALSVAVKTLSPVQQRIFVAKVLEGRRFAEIAQREGISEGAARNHLMRALKSIRTTLERYGLDP